MTGNEKIEQAPAITDLSEFKDKMKPGDVLLQGRIRTFEAGVKPNLMSGLLQIGQKAPIMHASMVGYRDKILDYGTGGVKYINEKVKRGFRKIDVKDMIAGDRFLAIARVRNMDKEDRREAVAKFEELAKNKVFDMGKSIKVGINKLLGKELFSVPKGGEFCSTIIDKSIDNLNIKGEARPADILNSNKVDIVATYDPELAKTAEEKKKNDLTAKGILASYAPFAATQAAYMPLVVKGVMESKNIQRGRGRAHGIDFESKMMQSKYDRNNRMGVWGSAYDPETGKVNVHIKDPKNLSKLEQGVLAHEYGHKKIYDKVFGAEKYRKQAPYKTTLEATMKNKRLAAMGIARKGSIASAVLSPFAIAKAENKEKALALTAAMPTLQLADEVGASAVGLRQVAKHSGGRAALRILPHSLAGIPTYAGIAAAPFIAYKAFKHD